MRASRRNACAGSAPSRVATPSPLIVAGTLPTALSSRRPISPVRSRRMRPFWSFTAWRTVKNTPTAAASSTASTAPGNHRHARSGGADTRGPTTSDPDCPTTSAMFCPTSAALTAPMPPSLPKSVLQLAGAAQEARGEYPCSPIAKQRTAKLSKRQAETPFAAGLAVELGGLLGLERHPQPAQQPHAGEVAGVGDRDQAADACP